MSDQIERPDPHDEQLSHALRRFDPVPPTVVASAGETFTWRTIDDELQQLGKDGGMTDAKEPNAIDPADDKLLQDLARTVARTDPVPPSVLAAARATFTWRTIDAELAALSYDSVLDERPLAGIRGAATERVLTFEASGVSIEVEVREDGQRRSIIAQLVPPQQADVALDHRDGTASVVADELGRFAVDDIPAGPVRLRVRNAGPAAVAVHTEWLPL